MKQFIILTLLFWVGSSNAQTADELNKRSLELLQQGEMEAAIPILQQAADAGHAEAQFNLGYCYYAGIAVEQNYEKAIELISKSADRGFNEAIFQMMINYASGNGVEQDYDKAFEFALKCAANDDETCIWNVINCYYDGIGVARDVNQVMIWSIRLAKMENPDNAVKREHITSSRFQLAYMYKEGTDIEQDLYKSYQWFLVYNESKSDFPSEQQEHVIQDIEALEEQLTVDQLALAAKEAEKILGRPLKNLDHLYQVEKK
ncbi:MAG: tetratricopeptide repeat protein [Chitinophagales bacterium]